MSFLDKLRRRNKKSDDSSYYRDEPTTNKFTALLFGLFALFITLLIAGGLFFGGRAVYRALNGTPAENTTEQKNNDGQNEQNKPAATPAPGSSSQNSAPSSQPTTGDTPSNVPSTGDSTPAEPALPRTGDEGM